MELTLEMSITIVLSALILGLMLGIIVLGENGLETAMGAHIANNMFIALFLNSSDSGLGNLPSLFTSSLVQSIFRDTIIDGYGCIDDYYPFLE